MDLPIWTLDDDDEPILGKGVRDRIAWYVDALRYVLAGVSPARC